MMPDLPNMPVRKARGGRKDVGQNQVETYFFNIEQGKRTIVPILVGPIVLFSVHTRIERRFFSALQPRRPFFYPYWRTIRTSHFE